MQKIVKYFVSSIVACSVLFGCIGVQAKNINGNTFPDIYVQGTKMEMASTPIKYIDNELYVPAREVMEAVGADVQWNEDKCETEIKFHNYKITLSGSKGSMEYTLGNESNTVDKSVVYVGNYNYIKLNSMESMLDINYDEYGRSNKISIRDYVPSSIEYKKKSFGKTNSEPVELSKGKTVGYTKNGLEIKRINRYFLWFIPIGYRIYVQTLDNYKYVEFTK